MRGSSSKMFCPISTFLRPALRTHLAQFVVNSLFDSFWSGCHLLPPDTSPATRHTANLAHLQIMSTSLSPKGRVAPKRLQKLHWAVTVCRFAHCTLHVPRSSPPVYHFKRCTNVTRPKIDHISKRKETLAESHPTMWVLGQSNNPKHSYCPNP